MAVVEVVNIPYGTLIQIFSMKNPFQIYRTSTAFLLIAVTASAPTVHAADKKVKSPKPAAAAPADLGNNIFILGEEVTPPTNKPTKSVPTQKGRRASRKRAAASPWSDANARLVGFCRSYLGHKLGNGQCSELPTLGLPAIGSQVLPNYQWGIPVCYYTAQGGRQYLQVAPAGKNAKDPRKVDVRPGDIIQYENVKFEQHFSDGGYAYQMYPHHTSVIEQVSADGRTYKVLEQNVNNTQIVLETVLHMSDMTEGTMNISRPLPLQRR